MNQEKAIIAERALYDLDIPFRPNFFDGLLDVSHLKTNVSNGTIKKGSEMVPHNPRIVLYSHDTMGLGHIRRNMKIAQTLSTSHLLPSILIVSGIPEARNFHFPPGVDCLTLPAVYKESDGQYRARNLCLTLKEIIAVRSATIQAAVRAFKPDVFIADNVPRGVSGELDATLEELRAYGHTRCVLGMRDIQDDPETVSREWRQRGYEEVIRRYYDEIWVYGDKEVYDTVKEYGYAPDLADKARYAGYLGQPARRRMMTAQNDGGLRSGIDLPKEPFVLCSVGGGQDGGQLAKVFSQTQLPDGRTGVIITGPYMDEGVRQQLYSRAMKNHRIRIFDFVSEPLEFLDHAECVVAMGGYNTVCEILSFEKKALIVPRVLPRQEQLIRAQRFQDLGLLDFLHPDRLNPQTLGDWLHGDGLRPPSEVYHRIDMRGLSRLPHMLEALFAGTSCATIGCGDSYSIL